MRTSHYFISTLKEAPADAEIVSHQLMLRAGLVRRLAGGIYTWMPIGLRVLRKVEAIIREEMNRAGAIELSMPAVQPAELWQESGRWEKYGPELLRLKDRHQRDFVIGPTHEEVITDVVRKEIKSYRQLPVHFYQVQSKFRDEIRPRFGVMRGREFLMKDGYSFHTSFDDLQREYRNMFDTYGRIFTRLGLKFRAVAASTARSAEPDRTSSTHVLADSGEDALAYCPSSDYAANVELAEALTPASARGAAAASLEKVATPGKTKCEDVAGLLDIPLIKMVKAIAVVRTESTDSAPQFVLILLRGDHDLNEVKAQKVLGEFRFAHDDEIVDALGCKPGYIGPVGVGSIPVFADRSVAAMSDFVCGANEAGFHIRGVNFVRDLPEPTAVADLRNVVAGDPSPDGKGSLELCRGVEVGHIFQLRTKYAEALKCSFLDENGQSRIMEMGCYGIGVSRIVGAAIEQRHDERGIVFPAAIAPFEVCIVPMGYAKSEAVKSTADTLYESLKAAGIDVLLDDRNERPGVMFAEMELIGVPHRIVVGERGLAEGKLEYKGRTDSEATMVPLADVVAFVEDKAVRRIALIVALALPFAALAGAQKYEPLSASVQAALSRAVADQAPPNSSFVGAMDAVDWLTEMSRRLEKRISNRESRIEFLRAVHYEATRAGLDPQMVLGLIQVESGFKKYAVSSAGARGFMQVMPFWVKTIGRSDDNLFYLRTNLRYGCTILRHYLDIENGDLFRALGRYNGSLGQADYPNLVRAAWHKDWNYRSERLASR